MSDYEQSMKLAYVTIFKATDIHAWSGLGTSILSALKRAGFEIDLIGDLSYKPDFLYKAKEVLYARLVSQRYLMLWDPGLLKSFARQVDRELARSDSNVVFSIWTNPIAYSRTDKPIVFWGDATLAGLISLYPAYRRLAPETQRDGHKAERLALEKCRLAIYSSTWAANSAIATYGADPDKVRVVPFGANISVKRDAQAVRSMVETRDRHRCRLLFVGVEWHRKGGDIALEVAEKLNRRGIPTELHIVGSHPPNEVPEFVKIHGFVSKKTEEGRALLTHLFSQSHFFILPARGDCTPVVFPEACSFGVPILTTDVGGIPTVIREGINGYMFSPEAGADAYCDTIERLWASWPPYERLALSSFGEYTERLNWEVASQQVADLLHAYCG